jgi:hypothetical protein
MDCLCGSELIQSGDHDLEEDDPYLMVSNFTCNECGVFILAYIPRDSSNERTRVDARLQELPVLDVGSSEST